MEDLEQKIKKYKSPSSIKSILDGGKTVFLVGVTGAGKDTILHKLLENPDYHLIVSHTTRPPRENHGIMEKDGIEYHFIDLKKAEDMVDNQEFVEVKWVHGKVYGTSVAELTKAHDGNKIAIADIEVQGVSEYCALSKNITPIFILPPSFDEWMRRFKTRYEGNPDIEEMRTRLNTARFELNEALKKDYFEFVINDDLDKAVKIADKIGHGDTSTEKNDEIRAIATNLLIKLENFLNN